MLSPEDESMIIVGMLDRDNAGEYNIHRKKVLPIDGQPLLGFIEVIAELFLGSGDYFFL